ncbi:unnamed protein product [Symbiodinium necroappetens]|uniref:Uncharacterized protein n=1 Tax=Symbiodinium necroappetens TaxID=1628268 RepID=A0A812VXM2_9DINO|nr:unnamed protein product [Symbiodinium necroappetens]
MPGSRSRGLKSWPCWTQSATTATPQRFRWLRCFMTWGKATYLTGDEVDEGDEGKQDDDDESMPEEEVVVLHEAYVVQETTKAKYREVAKASGVDPRVVQDNRPCIKDNKQALEDRVS